MPGQARSRSIRRAAARYGLAGVRPARAALGRRALRTERVPGRGKPIWRVWRAGLAGGPGKPRRRSRPWPVIPGDWNRGPRTAPNTRPRTYGLGTHGTDRRHGADGRPASANGFAGRMVGGPKGGSNRRGVRLRADVFDALTPLPYRRSYRRGVARIRGMGAFSGFGRRLRFRTMSGGSGPCQAARSQAVSRGAHCPRTLVLPVAVIARLAVNPALRPARGLPRRQAAHRYAHSGPRRHRHRLRCARPARPGSRSDRP